MHPFSAYPWVLFFSALLLTWVGITLYNRKGASRQFAYAGLGTALWVGTYGIELLSTTLDQMLFWTQIQYVGSSFIPAFLVEFHLVFTGRDHLITWRNRLAWFAIPAITCLLALTTPYQQLLFAGLAVDYSGPFPLLDITRGPWYWVYISYFYGVMVWALVLLVRRYRSTEGLYRQQTLLIIGAWVFPWITNVFYLTGYRPFGHVDLTPFAFIATSLSVAFGLLRYRLFDVVPIARENVFDGLADGVLVLDKTKRIVDANPAMKRLLEAHVHEIIGLEYQQLVRRVPEFRPLMDAVPDKGIRLVINESDTTWLVTETPILEHGKPSGWVQIWRDITEEERFEAELKAAKEQAETSDRLKTAFLANMSHEIRNPLHALLGFTEILRDPATPADERDRFVDIIDKNARQLLSLINGIIDLSKVESGVETVETATMNGNRMLTDLHAFFGPSAAAKGIRLRLRTPFPDTRMRFRSDPAKVRQILINLIGNALKYTDHGHIELAATIEDGFVRFTVSDTGVGIDQDSLNIIFNRFEQAKTRSPNHIGGTGLGLSISNAYARLLGGRIDVESVPGSGSTFRLLVPYHPDELTAPEAPVNDANPPTTDWSDKTLLLAEDETVNIRFIQLVLKKTGIRIISATDGNEAVAMATGTDQPDLILLDIMMPGMDGFEAARAMRDHGIRTPIYALSGHAMVEPERLRQAGIDRILTKPIQGRELIAAMAQVLGT